ncbi:MAG: uracil-DNA glycosylase family protein [Firmicutes bacterium]|nr:uracil-DNA glycosylase family protein [Bacillota bacterium]
MHSGKNNSKKDLIALQKEILRCRLCEHDFGYKPRPVVQGSHNAKIMQISQAPSKTVHETGKPFNDASGKKLVTDWYKISWEDFYSPEKFYIVSMAHCYPGKAPGGGDRRPPKICSQQWLSKEIELVDNKLYIIIGGFAAKLFFPNESFTELVFEDREINNKPAYIMPHPSPLNVKWFKDNPAFAEKRIIKIRDDVNRLLKGAR